MDDETKLILAIISSVGALVAALAAFISAMVAKSVAKQSLLMAYRYLVKDVFSVASKLLVTSNKASYLGGVLGKYFITLATIKKTY